MKKAFIVFCFILSLVFVSGCGVKNANTNNSSANEKYDEGYPIKTNQTLTYWGATPVHQDYKSFEEQPFFQELMKRTGVKIIYRSPVAGQAKEAFNLLIASNDLPDIIQYDWAMLPGGPEKYISSGYIIPLNEQIKKFAPNLSAYLAANPEIDKFIKSDSGTYYAFPRLTKGNVYGGMVVREDWLKDLGLALPETIDDWYNTLKSFKEKKSSTGLVFDVNGMLGTAGAFSGAYGVKMNYYLDDGKVVYGPMQAGWKEFLKTFNQWYNEGLIDPDFPVLDSKMLTSRIVSGKTGSIYGSAGSIGQWIDPLRKTDTKALLAGAKYPVLNKGEIAKFGQKDSPYAGHGCAAITTNCKNVELATRFLDYKYSHDGRLLHSFGIEGVSYNMVNGVPTYTDDINKDYSKAYKYISETATILDYRAFEQRMRLPEQKEAISRWSETEAIKHMMPSIIPTEEESNELSKIVSEIDTYTNEMIIKFIFGNESINKFDDYVNQLKKMQIEKVIQIKQAEVERYKNR
jgi:putative aldouronate transport system substrate-binding protein